MMSTTELLARFPELPDHIISRFDYLRVECALRAHEEVARLIEPESVHGFGQDQSRLSLESQELLTSTIVASFTNLYRYLTESYAEHAPMDTNFYSLFRDMVATMMGDADALVRECTYGVRLGDTLHSRRFETKAGDDLFSRLQPLRRASFRLALRNKAGVLIGAADTSEAESANLELHTLEPSSPQVCDEKEWAERSASNPAEQEISNPKSPPIAADNELAGTRSDRHKAMSAYIEEVFKRTGKRITRTDIWRSVGYRSRTEFE